jgi:hypothetical protein
MISVSSEPSFEGLAARLAAKARMIAEARTQSMALAKRGDPLRWRKAGLVWPLFTKG